MAGRQKVDGRQPLKNPRHERFCHEYLKDLNGSAAYQRTGYQATGNAAETNAGRLLRGAQVGARVAYLQQERAQRVQLEQDQVLRELGLLGLSNIEHYELGDLGQVQLKVGAPEGALRAISSVKRRAIIRADGSVVREVEYRLWDKPAALNMLGKHLGLFVKRVKLGVDEGTGVLVVPSLGLDRDAWAALAGPHQARVGGGADADGA
jgi:phage terminase small subunit